MTSGKVIGLKKNSSNISNSINISNNSDNSSK